MKAGRGGRVGDGTGSSAGDAAGEKPGALRESDPLGLAAEWQRAGRKVALAMVVETWGSSPCPAGSLLAVDDRGHFEGSVSGGCVEGAVIERAATVLETGRAETLEFGIADETAWSVGLACGGRVRIYVERLES